ncbi:class I SAM-dependent methyltransferase [Aurantimonas sp. VKM B-3413]|uniref:class I SAM-dependent methyltransferase n=1 Tax=Aurantimonas sp. VKM B-3413 TaxID=2779401 RepID=UPI001E2CC1C4|nr:methyltransferase domain-containing protein [Aurantimonas sp. VKM B-3413]MCB8837337.1 class I SAM-dependent methyltransferase [Aurantimonas sp. VKM B-3413]
MPAPADHIVFDRSLLDRRRLRQWRAGRLREADFLLRAVADELAERLSLVERRFSVAVELGGHTGTFAERLRASGQADTVVRIERLPELLAGDPAAIVGDEEALPLAEASVDLVVSPLSLQLVNDTPGALIQIRRALRPDGLFLCGFLGGETLHELRAALLAAEAERAGGVSPRVAPFADIRDAGGLLQRAGFALPVTDIDRITVRYDTLFDLMMDLRAMGMANMLVQRSRRPAAKGLFLRAAELYAERFRDPDGRVRATFDIVYLSGWRPHDSQQKPLRPGSGKASLADALKDRSGDY